jgi:2-oxo-4-hydroxy-4-carboxy-5-ureidoimidazoline decarboxylase
MKLEELNLLPKAKALDELMRCCAAKNWAEGMLEARPYKSFDALINTADAIWNRLSPDDWLEAFSAHPKIGDVNAGDKKFSRTKDWSSDEQKSVLTAGQQLMADLASGNAAYEEKFGFTFIVCATGKTAAEMLTILKARLGNSKEQELRKAAREQAKITRLRLEKLLT